MDTKLVESVTKEYKKVKHPHFQPGDIIEVHTRILEGGKERIQIFKGIVIAMKGAGISRTFTVRKISYGVGVEKIYPLYSPVIAKIKKVKKSKVKRSKLYYLRDRIGKAALKAGVQIPAEGEDIETQQEESSEDVLSEKKPVEKKEKEEKKKKSSEKENSETEGDSK